MFRTTLRQTRAITVHGTSTTGCTPPTTQPSAPPANANVSKSKTSEPPAIVSEDMLMEMLYEKVFKSRNALKKRKLREKKTAAAKKRKQVLAKKAADREVRLRNKKLAKRALTLKAEALKLKKKLEKRKKVQKQKKKLARKKRALLSVSGAVTARTLFVQKKLRGKKKLTMAMLSRKWKNMTKVQKKPFEVEARKNLMKRTVIRESLKQPPNAYALFTKEHFTRLYQIELKKGGAKKDAFAAATRECSKLFKSLNKKPGNGRKGS